VRILVTDFETFYSSEYSLGKMTTESYVRDPRFETIGAGLLKPGGPKFWLRGSQFTALARQIDWSDTALVAHHAHFDGLVLSHHYNVVPGFYFDTLSMARTLYGAEVGNSLKVLAERLGVGQKGDEQIKAKGKRFVDFTEGEWLRYGGYCLNDCNLTLGVFLKMLEQFPADELKLIDLTVRMFTQPRLVGDEQVLKELIIYERDRKKTLLQQINANKEDLMSNDKFARLLIDLEVEPPIKPSPTRRDENNEPIMIWAFAKTDPGFQELLESDVDEVRWLAEARVGVKSTQNETRAQRFLTCAQRGPMPVYLKYAAAHTNRWGGGDKMNWQNLGRVDKKRPETGKLRRSVRAPTGYKLCVADSAQIEARFTAWTANQQDLVQAFAEGRDVYSEFATDAYSRPITKDNVIERFVGKTCVLGLGFEMGWYRLAMEFQKGAMGGNPVIFDEQDVITLKIDPSAFLDDGEKLERVRNMPSRLELAQRITHCMVCEFFVRRYRSKNRCIVRLWKLMSELLDEMHRGGGYRFGYLGFLQTVKDGILLPNGLTLRYPHLEKSEHNGYSYLNDHKRTHLFGGKATENLIQALARIAASEWMLEIAKEFPIVLFSHDEIGWLAPESDAEAALEHGVKIMSVAPAWARGLPVAAEGGIGDNYADAKP